MAHDTPRSTQGTQFRNDLIFQRFDHSPFTIPATCNCIIIAPRRYNNSVEQRNRTHCWPAKELLREPVSHTIAPLTEKGIRRTLAIKSGLLKKNRQNLNSDDINIKVMWKENFQFLIIICTTGKYE